MKFSQISKRTKNAIIRNIKKLEEKYGEDVVRMVVNKYYKLKKERKYRERRIRELERELEELKKEGINW